MIHSTKRTLVLSAVLALGLSGTALAAADVYRIDTAHSRIGFAVRHLVSRTHGRFAKFEGTITLDPADQKSTLANVQIDAASITTDNERRDGDLKSENFFAVDSFPAVTFRSTGVEPASAESGTMTGDLTIKGITKPVELSYTILGMDSGKMGRMLGLEATGKINRKDFNILWNRDLDDGKTLLGDEVALEITVEARTEQPKPAAKTN